MLCATDVAVFSDQQFFFQNDRIYLSNDAFYTCLQKAAFPVGFYVVFVVKGDNWDCSGYYETVTIARNKSLKFLIEPSITYHSYIISTISVLLVFALFYVFSIVVSVVYFIKWVHIFILMVILCLFGRNNNKMSVGCLILVSTPCGRHVSDGSPKCSNTHLPCGVETQNRTNNWSTTIVKIWKPKISHFQDMKVGGIALLGFIGFITITFECGQVPCLKTLCILHTMSYTDWTHIVFVTLVWPKEYGNEILS